MANEKKCKVVVICGGTSSERQVSLRSGNAVVNALRSCGYEDVCLFDLKDNIKELLQLKPDVVYLTLHGEGGEDGKIQGFLETVGIPYTGCDVVTSAICMDKILTKQILKNGGVPTPDFYVIEKNLIDFNPSVVDEIIEKIGLPLVLKSPCQGSSIGVEIVKTREEFDKEMRELFLLDSHILAEKYVRGIEVTVPVIGNEQISMLPIVEIEAEHEFYDYETKYTKGMCKHIIPARISEALRDKVLELSERTYSLLRCRDLARIDFIIDEKEGPMVLEINTLPGMTEMSLFPDSARVAGMSFEKLVQTVLEFAEVRKK